MKRAVLGILCILVFVSCSRLDVAVNWADSYIVSQVDDYFDLTSQQSRDLKDLVKKDLWKIRREQFPLWAKELKNLARDIDEGNLSQERFHTYFVRTMKAAQKVPTYFTNTAVRFISTASPDQLKHFEGTLRKKNIENEEKIQNSQQARYEARKKYLRWTSMGIDSLSKEQNQLLNQHLDDTPFPAQMQIKNKNRILEKFKEAQKSPETLRTFVRNYYSDKSQYMDSDYRNALEGYQRSIEKFVFRLLSSLNEKQKRFLTESITDKANTLERLATNQ